jgi:hypothetical protein
MTGQPLRLTTTGELPAPRADSDSAAIVTEAVEALARVRTPYWLGNAAVGLHILASLINQAEQMLPAAVTAARDQEHTQPEIAQLLGISQAAAARRYRGQS